MESTAVIIRLFIVHANFTLAIMSLANVWRTFFTLHFIYVYDETWIKLLHICNIPFNVCKSEKIERCASENWRIIGELLKLIIFWRHLTSSLVVFCYIGLHHNVVDIYEIENFSQRFDYLIAQNIFANFFIKANDGKHYNIPIWLLIWG